MKKLLILILLVPYVVLSQLKTLEDGTLYFEEIVENEKAIQNNHDAVEQFLATYSGDSNTSIKINKEDQILAKLAVPIIGPNKINVVLNTEFKEGKYRIVIDEMLLNDKYPFSTDRDFNIKLALKQIEETYLKKGEIVKFREMEESGAALEEAEMFVDFTSDLQIRGNEKLLLFIDSFKDYINKFKTSDW